MAESTREQLEALRDSLIRSGGSGGKTSAANVRDMVTSLIESLLNILDDVDSPGGFLGIDSDGRVDVSKINSATTPTSLVLQGDGAWRKMRVGNRSANGDGVTTTFSMVHGAGFTPTYVLATAFGADGAGAFYTTNYTATTFDIVYLVAPGAGSGNIRINFAVF